MMHAVLMSAVRAPCASERFFWVLGPSSQICGLCSRGITRDLLFNVTGESLAV
jgi:hypothetical protein